MLDLKSYNRNGFVVVRSVFTRAEINDLIVGFEELTNQAKDFRDDTFIGFTYFNLHRPCDPFDPNITTHAPFAGELRRVTYPYAVSTILNQLRTSDALLRAVEHILGENLVQIVNQANFNPPQKGTGWGWHQDYRFRRQGLKNMPQSFVQTLTAVDRCSSANGGVKLVAKSHQLGPLGDTLATQKIMKSNQTYKIVQPELEPGDAVFFNPYVIHGSSANRSSQLRRVYINGFARSEDVEHGITVMQHGNIVNSVQGTMEYESEAATLKHAEKAS